MSKFKELYKTYKTQLGAEDEKKKSESEQSGGNFKNLYNTYKKELSESGSANAAAPVSTLTTDERRQRTLNILSQSRGALKAGASAMRPSGGTMTGAGPTKYAQYRREIEDLKKSGASGQLIKAKKNEFNQYKTDIYNQKRERRKANLQNKAEKDPDFAAMVQKGKNIYDTVNKEKDRKKFSVSFSPENMSHVGAGDMEDWVSRNYKLNNFTDDERNTYLYILGKEGWTAADKYEELISRDVNARTAAKETEFLADWARKNKPAAVALNTASSFLGGAALADTLRQGIRNAGRSDADFVPADNNSGAFLAPRIQSAMTEGITGDIKSPAGKFMAQTGLSTANFLANAAVGGGAVSLGLMGANAGGSGAYEAIERGATPGQAAMLGLVNAAAEIAFERIPVGEFGKLASGDVKKIFARAMIDMAKEEGMEELATEYVNLLGDNIIMGDNSEMQAYIRELMAQGMSEDEAKKAALEEFAVKRPALAFLGGAVSGAGIGAAGVGIGRVNMMMDPAMQEIVKTVQESTGMSKAEAWSAVFKAAEGGSQAETENKTANAENVPAEFEAFNEAEQEADGQDWREELISAVMENSNMNRADAERAVSEASGDIVPTAEQNEPERIWERAAREQAAYDAEWERAHQPTAEELTQDYEARRARTAEAMNEAEAQEQAKQEQAVNDALIQRAVNGFNETYGRFTHMQDDFREWLLRDIEKNGIPEVYQGDLARYAEDIISDLEYEVGQEYGNARGSTIEARTRRALQTVLARDGRTSFAQAEPNQAEPEQTDNYQDNESRFYGDNPYKNRADAEEILALAQEQTRAKRQYDRLIAERRLTGDDISILRGVLSTTNQVWRNGGDAVPRIMELLRRNSIESGTDISRLADERLIQAAIDYSYINEQLEERGRTAKKDARELAQRIVSEEQVFGNAQDKRSGFRYARETFERNSEDVTRNPEAAQRINDAYYEPVHKETKNQKLWLDKEREGMKALNIDTGKKKLYQVRFNIPGGGVFNGNLNEDGIVQAYGEGLISDYTLDELTDSKGNKIDADKVRNAVKWISGEYKKIIDSVNLILIEYGYEPIPERQNYFPHYTETEFSGLKGIFAKLGIDLSERALPTDIAGMTENFKPGKQWVGNFMRRRGVMTDYGAIRGMDRYIDTVSNVLFHTGNIQKLRAFSDAIRAEYAPDSLSRQIEEIRNDIRRGDIKFEDGQNRINRLTKDIGISKLPNYVTWLDEYTNNLAGKNSKLDRETEYLFGRKSLSIFKSINDRAASNMVGYNMATPFTNIIPITQADISAKNKLRGFADTIRNAMNNDGLMDDSVFYANRIGAKPLIQTKLQTFADKSGFLMNLMDRTIAESIVRGRYYDNIEKGMDSEAAMKDADNHAGRVMADRSKGSVPLILQTKNPILKTLTMFQTEVNNQYSYMFKDIPRAYKDKGMAMIMAQLAKVFFGAFVFNELYEKVIGRRPAFDPIDIMTTAVDNFSGRERNNLLDVILEDADLYEDKEIGTYDALAATGKDVAEEIPFIGGILGGGRVPVSDALPDIPAIVKNAIEAKENPESAEKNRDKIIKEVIKPAAYLAAPAGGIQAKKVYQGLSDMIHGGSYVHNDKGEDILRYPVDNSNPANWVKNAMFGRTASEGYQTWRRNGFKNLSARQTEAYPKIVQAGIDYDTYMQFVFNISGVNSKWETARTIYDMKGLTNAQKNIIWKNAVRADYAEKGNQPDFTMKKNEFYDTWHGKEDKE